MRCGIGVLTGWPSADKTVELFALLGGRDVISLPVCLQPCLCMRAAGDITVERCLVSTPGWVRDVLEGREPESRRFDRPEASRDAPRVSNYNTVVLLSQNAVPNDGEFNAASLSRLKLLAFFSPGRTSQASGQLC